MLGWAAFIFSAAGAILISQGKPCLIPLITILWSIASILWISYGFFSGDWPIVAVNFFYLFFELRAYITWRKTIKRTKEAIDHEDT